MGLPNVRAAVCRARLFHRPAIDPRAILSLSLRQRSPHNLLLREQSIENKTNSITLGT